MDCNNLKCPECGYVFEGDVKTSVGDCPLCSSEYNTVEALKLFEENESNKVTLTPKKKSTKQIILEWLAFFGSFIAFIGIAYMIINYILGA